MYGLMFICCRFMCYCRYKRWRYIFIIISSQLASETSNSTAVLNLTVGALIVIGMTGADTFRQCNYVYLQQCTNEYFDQIQFEIRVLMRYTFFFMIVRVLNLSKYECPRYLHSFHV